MREAKNASLVKSQSNHEHACLSACMWACRQHHGHASNSCCPTLEPSVNKEHTYTYCANGKGSLQTMPGGRCHERSPNVYIPRAPAKGDTKGDTKLKAGIPSKNAEEASTTCLRRSMMILNHSRAERPCSPTSKLSWLQRGVMRATAANVELTYVSWPVGYPHGTTPACSPSHD
jgi:hypothetical protein